MGTRRGEKGGEKIVLMSCYSPQIPHGIFFGRNPELHGERPATRYPSDGREQSGIPTVFKWL